ncbi:MAG: hypothetical protein HY308_10275 [Gammaproteobacteria bacterium]|nr:hypothetical protein [Gammaproteobacteria bacterium]
MEESLRFNPFRIAAMRITAESRAVERNFLKAGRRIEKYTGYGDPRGLEYFETNVQGRFILIRLLDDAI